MTVDLTKIVHGEPGWDGHLNQDLNNLNDDTFHLLGGAVSKQNLVLNSSAPKTTEHWSTPAGGGILVIRNGFYKNGKVSLFSLVHDKTSPQVNEEVQAVTDEYVLQSNTNYDVFFVAFGAVGITSFDAYMICHDKDGNLNNINLVASVVPNPSKAVLYKFSFNSGNSISGVFRIDNNGSIDGVDHNLFFGDIFVGKSEFWAPASGDVRGDDTGLVYLTMVGAIKGLYSDTSAPKARRVNDVVHLTSGIIATADIPNNTRILAMPNQFLGADGGITGFCRNTSTQDSFPVTVRDDGLYIAKTLSNGQMLDFAGMTYLGRNL